MIKRKYFFSCSVHGSNGRREVMSGMATRVSLFDQADDVLNECMKRAKEKGSHLGADAVREIYSFNRL